MVEVKNVEVFGLNRAINAINNSFNVGPIDTTVKPDIKRENVARALGKNMDTHQSHDAFLKGITVYMDVKGNGVFMPELQRYHFYELVMSQSTMHSMEKFMTSDYDPFTKYVDPRAKDIIKEKYNNWAKAKESGDKEKIYTTFEEMVHTLPRGFELWFTAVTNYLQLKTIVVQRWKHKNREDWSSLIAACYSMPHFRELCGFKDSKWDLENW